LAAALQLPHCCNLCVEVRVHVDMMGAQVRVICYM